MITPSDVDALVIAAVREWHQHHLAAFERARGLEARTIQPFQTVAVMRGNRQAGDREPAALVGCVGVADRPARTEGAGWDVTWVVGVDVSVVGTGRRDAARRRDAMAMTTIECVTTRVPSCVWVDLELVEEASGDRVRASARIVLHVTTTGAVPDRDGWEPDAGTDPYEPPLDAPHAEHITVTVTRQEP